MNRPRATTKILMRCVRAARRSSIPFGTLGATHFRMKTLPKVATEMALHVLAYNLTRAPPAAKGTTIVMGRVG
jgi:hypothetical protein